MRLVLLVVVGVAAGCHTTQQLRQTGLVPPPRPILYDGQPMTRPMRIEGHASTVVTPQEPTRSPRGNSVYVARDTVGAGFFGMRGEAELGISIDAARSRAATRIAPEVTDPVPKENAYSVVFSARHSMPVNESVSVGLAADIGWTRVPITINGGEDRDTNNVPVFRGGVVPSWRSGPLVVYAGLHLVSDIEVPATVTIDSDDSSEAAVSGAAMLASGGASVRFDNGVRLTTQVAKPWGTEFDHGVQVDLVLGIEFGDPPPQPPPMY